MSAGCPISVENVWGPTVARSCLQGFDFTLFFEETILSILPLGLAICLVPLRLRTLRTSRIKVVASSRLHICKLVSRFDILSSSSLTCPDFLRLVHHLATCSPWLVEHHSAENECNSCHCNIDHRRIYSIRIPILRGT